MHSPSLSARTITPLCVEHVLADRVGVLVGRRRDRPHPADAAGVADDAVGGERLQAAAEAVLDVLGPLDETFATDDLEVLQAGRARRGVAGVGEAVAQEEVGVALQRGGGGGADEHAAEREVARRDLLGEGGQVGRDAVVVGGEPAAGAAEAGDDLVEDEVRAVLVAQLAQRLQVAVRWRDTRRRRPAPAR